MTRPWTIRRFWERVDKSTECWLWTGRLDEKGYGTSLLIAGGGKSTKAHRVAFFLTTGRWPQELDHLCRNRACVNPDHLEEVTHSENMARGGVALRMFCPEGHPLAGGNLYLYPKTEARPNGGRGCRICRTVQTREYKQRRREAASG